VPQFIDFLLFVLLLYKSKAFSQLWVRLNTEIWPLVVSSASIAALSMHEFKIFYKKDNKKP